METIQRKKQLNTSKPTPVGDDDPSLAAAKAKHQKAFQSLQKYGPLVKKVPTNKPQPYAIAPQVKPQAASTSMQKPVPSTPTPLLAFQKQGPPPVEVQSGLPTPPQIPLAGMPAAPTQPKPQQPNFASYGLGDALKETVSGKWKAAQQSVDDAGQGKYVGLLDDVEDDPTGLKGVGALVNNVTQVPYLGKGLSALGNTFILATGTPAELAEQAIGSVFYSQKAPTAEQVKSLPFIEVADKINKFLGAKTSDEAVKAGNMVTEPGNVNQERAFHTAMKLAYSGDDAVRKAYDEALSLQNSGELTEEKQQEIQAKHGVWWKEMAGQVILDPLNLLDAPGKLVLQGTRIRNAEKSLLRPALSASGELATTADIAKGFKEMATVKGQLAASEGVVDSLKTLINPRYKESVVVREVERMQQPLNVAFGNAAKRAEVEAIQFWAKDSADYIANYNRILSDNIQDVATQMVRMASDDVAEVKRAHELFKGAEFGDIAASTPGRRAGYTLRKMMEKPDGSLGQLTDILQQATDQGLKAEHVAEAWAVKARDVMDELVDVPKFETSAPVKGALYVNKKLAPINDAFAKLFMGMSFGYAMRNIQSDAARMAIDGWSHFSQAGKGLAEAKGINLVGRARGVGAAGEVAGGNVLFNFGLKLGEKFEKISSGKVFDQAFADALDRTWRKAAESGAIQIPTTGDVALDRYMQRVVEGLHHKDITAIDKLKADVLSHLSASPAAGVLPPAGPGVAGNLDLWRNPRNDLLTATKNTDPAAFQRVQDILANSDTPESAAVALDEVISDYIRNLPETVAKSEPVGPAPGTMVGEAVQQMARTEKFAPETIEDLSESLAMIEKQLKYSHAQSLASAQLSVQGGEWGRVLDDAQEIYGKGVDAIRREQTVLYMELEAGLITEKEYVDEIFHSYRKVKTALDQEFSRVLGESGGVPLVGTAEQMQQPLLQREVLREGFLSGYPSGVVKKGEDAEVAARSYTAYRGAPDVAPDMHFRNKISKIIGRKVTSVNDLTPDEAIQIINEFRNIREIDPTDYQQIYDRYARLSQTPNAPDLLKEPFDAVPVSKADRKRYLSDEDLENWGMVYDVDDKGDLIFRPIAEALAEGNPDFRNIVFRRGDDGVLRANRSAAHAPSDAVLDAQLLSDDSLALSFSQAQDAKTISPYARELIDSGIPADTIIIGPAAHPLYKEGMTIGDLAGPAPIPEASILDVQPGQYDELLNNPKVKANEESRLASQALKESLAGNVPPLQPGPGLADVSITSTSDMVQYLTAMREEILGVSKLPPAAATALLSPEIPAALDQFFEQLKQVHTNTTAVSADAARRARDFTLLDYRDRRLADPFIKILYPWSYWHTRSLPNWATGLVMNPAMVAHYMAYKRELRDWNDQDPTIPEYAKDQLVLHPPGFDGSVYYNMEAAFNPVAQMFDSYTDPERTKNELGKFIAKASSFGPATHPLLMAAYAAERGLVHGDAEGARTYGYVAPISRVFNAVIGATLEPWLWLGNHKEGGSTPWTGGTAGEQSQAGRFLAGQQQAGELGSTEAMYGAALRQGPEYENALQNILRTRQIPTLASWLLGVSLQPQNAWEEKLNLDKNEFMALRTQQEAGDGTAKAKIAKLFADKPWLSTLFMASDNERERIAQLAKSVFNRIPPGSSAEALFAKAGVISEMRDAFYEPGNKLSDWQRGDYEQFANGIINLAGLLKGPEGAEAKQWTQARTEWKALREQTLKNFPGYEEQSATYQKLLATSGEDAAKEYGQTSGFFNALNFRQDQMLKSDVLLKFYGDPLKIDTAVNSLAYDEAERRWPGIHALNDQYHSLPKEQQRQFLQQNPTVAEWWSQNDNIKRQIQGDLSQARNLAGSADSVPATTDSIIKGQPSITQRGILNAIAEMELQEEVRPEAPAIPEGSFTDQEFQTFQASSQAYATAQANHPDAAAKEQVYTQIKTKYGPDAAKLFAQANGLYEYWNEVTVNKVGNPQILASMTDEQLTKSSKAMVNYVANQQFPGINNTQTQYYALPKGKPRKAFLQQHPELKNYWGWKEIAEPQIVQKLYERRNQLLQ